MTESSKTGPEAAAPEGTAASAASPAPVPAVRTSPSLFKAILLSLFVCPGMGHRAMGRIRAGWIVIGLFLLSFLYLGVSLNHLVQEVVTQMQSQRSTDLFRIVSRVEAACKNAPDVSQALELLLIVYFGAPVELLLTWLCAPAGKSEA